MKTPVLLFFILLCFTTPIFALDSGFAGIGPEINSYSREGVSFGGNFIFGIDLNDSFSIGLKTGFFDNFDTVSALETSLFFRYYLPWLHVPKNIDGPFAQLEAGGVILFERGYHEYPEVFPSFAGGLSLGWRFNLGEHWYLEPAVRGGYPHIWGFSVTVGIKFGNQKVNKKEIDESDAVEGINVIRDDDGNLRLQMFSIMFRNDQADFTGLSDETIKANYETIKYVAELLKKYKDYTIIIEGHANPTTSEGRARERERDTLLRISEQRALKVMEILNEYGVSSGRMSVSGAGFSKMLVPYNDNENNWKNRRVKIILINE